MPATHITTNNVPTIYKRFSTAISPQNWQGAVQQQREEIKKNPFLEDYLFSEHAIAFQLEKLRIFLDKYGTIPIEYCNVPNIIPAITVATQVLAVLDMSSTKQAKEFVKRVRNAFKTPEEMHALRLELQAATHFARQGHSVVWHRVGKKATFDLLIDNLGTSGLEVECKLITENKGRRIHRRDALDFWGELWKNLGSLDQNLLKGLAVVLTLSARLPEDLIEKDLLSNDVVKQILAGCSGVLANGSDLRITEFEPAEIESKRMNSSKLRAAINTVTGTTNREALIKRTSGGGMLIFVLQSALDDNLIREIFSTLSDSAGHQFSKQRAGLFWVQLQGIEADQLLSLHEHDNTSGSQPSSLQRGVSDFLNQVPDHIVGVVFSSKSSLIPVTEDSADMGGLTYYFTKKNGPYWHESFFDPLNGLSISKQPEHEA